MAIDDILKFVEKETAAECEKILEEARRAVREIEIAFEENRKASDDNFKKRLENARRAVSEAAMRDARMTLRIETLNAKKRLLDEVYDKILEKIKTGLGDEKTLALYEKLIKMIPSSARRTSSAGGESAEIIISPSDAAVWKKLKSHIPDGARIVESKDITKGFMYKTADALWDFTAENLVSGFRAATESRLAKELFGS